MAHIEMKKICKVYPPDVVALEEVDFSLNKGEVHSIVGENGAGKSTLMKILYGMLRPSSGRIFVDGKEVKIHSPNRAIELGIGMVHQEFMLVPSFRVFENVMLGMEQGFMNRSNIKEDIQKIIERYNFEIDLDAVTSELSVAAQQKVEILKQLYRRVDTLILDEPTSVLTPQETRQLFEEIGELKKNGKTAVFISHKLDEVLEVSDRITIMRKGKRIDVVENRDVSKAELARMMVGREVIFTVEKPPEKLDGVVFSAKNLSAVSKRTGRPAVNDVNIDVRAGEIVGIAGVEGNGQHELVEAVIGSGEVIRGKIFVDGKDMIERSIKERRNYIAYVPADRKGTGLALDGNLRENISMTHHLGGEISKGRYIFDWKKAENLSGDLINRYSILCRSFRDQVKNLSGGNQQKVVVAREFSLGTVFVLLDQPTRGLDVGSIEFIHRSIIEMREANRAILLISADLDELMRLADRIYVMRNGKIEAELDPKKVSKEDVGAYMLGAHE